MLNTIKRVLPDRFKHYMKHAGITHYCPVCGSYVKRFKPFGIVSRRHDNAQCPICGAQERHRMVWVFFHEQTNLFDPTAKRMLHIAPENFFEKEFAKHKQIDRLTADLLMPNVMVKMDITDIQYPDNSFDVIYCSHVLEHVPEDRIAMSEFFRVLKPGGWAIFMVPIEAEETFEDPSITDPSERERLFYQNDHVRVYGPDFQDRLENTGFKVKKVAGHDFLSPRRIKRLALYERDFIYWCAK